MQDELSGLTAFLAVARGLSFTGAAAHLRVTPSAISQSVRALEERVGVRLVQRTTRSVGLTEAGARFYARLEPAIAGVQEAYESLGELRDRPAGRLRLNLPRLGYELVLAPKLGAFMHAYPEIELELALDDGFTDIVAEGFDAGIRIGEMLDREMIGVRVSAELRVAIVGAPSYFASRGKPKRPRDLLEHECINYRRRTSGAIYRWELTEGGKDLELAVNGRVIVDDAEAMLDAAVAGLGLAHLIEPTVRKLIDEKKLVRVLERYCPPFPGLYLYYPSRAQIAPKLRALVDWLRVDRPRKR
jgi:DNA-binding transcriptional LysR family regulator